MKTCLNRNPDSCGRRAFTLVELMVAASIGCLMAGTIVIMLVQALTEQRRGLGDMGVEQGAFILQGNITSCLRSMSANQGMTPDYSSALLDSFGNTVGYQSVFIFTPTTNGTYVAGNIKFDSSTGKVTYIPNLAAPNASSVWVSNSTAVVMRKCCFSTSFNPDGSQNSSLINVLFQMDDNGFSGQSGTNNPASIYRNFAVQMRNDS